MIVERAERDLVERGPDGRDLRRVRRWATSSPRSERASSSPSSASSSCSYAAVAIAKSLFQKGASAASARAFQFASTNLAFFAVMFWLTARPGPARMASAATDAG